MRNVDHIVRLDSVLGKKLLFTSVLFTQDSYMWRTGNEIWIWCIESKQKRRGNLRRLLDKIHAAGFSTVVAYPQPLMRRILAARGFKAGKCLDGDGDLIGAMYQTAITGTKGKAA